MPAYKKEKPEDIARTKPLLFTVQQRPTQELSMFNIGYALRRIRVLTWLRG